MLKSSSSLSVSSLKVKRALQYPICRPDGDVVVFSFHFLNKFFISVNDMIDDIGECNVPDCFLISWKNIFFVDWSILNHRGLRFLGVCCRRIGWDYLLLGMISEVQLCMFFRLLMHRSMSSDWSSRRHSLSEFVWGFCRMECWCQLECQYILYCWTSFFFCKSTNMLMHFFLLFDSDKISQVPR